MPFHDISLTYHQAIILVLVASVLHATWNAVVKKSDNKSESFLVIAGWAGIILIPFLPFIPLPDVKMMGILTISICAHTLYYITLTNAYKVGDFGYVYPIARGLSPLLVTLYAFGFLGESLPALALIGVLMVAIGIMGNVLENGLKNINKKALFWSIACGFSISFYSVIDGIGARTAENPLYYVVYIQIMELLIFWTWGGIKFGKGFFVRSFTKWEYIIGGTASFFAYAIVLFAIAHAPMGVVSAVRETSTVFAAIIAWLIFKEALGKRRIINACIVSAGVILIVLSA